MRGALIHGILLAVMLVYGYRTWTRDKTVQPNVGDVVLWNKTEGDIASIEYASPKKIVKLEKAPGGYWWGTDTTVETKVLPAKTPPAGAGSAAGSGAGSAGSAAAGSVGSGAGSAGSGAGSGKGSAAAPEPPPIEEEETGRKTREFPLGDAGDKLVEAYTKARALRDLGKPNDAQKKDYKLDNKPTNIVTMKDGKQVSTSTVTVKFKDGSSRAFTVGGSVYGGSDKYVLDNASGKAFVFSKDLLSGLEIGESSLHLFDPRGFDANKINSVTIDAGGKSKTVARVTTKGGADGNQDVKTWGDPVTKKADQTAANFVDNANNLRPTEYAANLKISDLTPVMKLTYKDERGALLGTLQLYRHEKPGTLPEGQELDPANPPKSETEYYIVTEKTRVPALVRKDTAQRSEQDIETVFSGKPADTKSVDPHGNPFGPNAPKPDLHPGAGSAAAPGIPGAPGAGSAAAANPHAAMPGMGSAAAANPHAAMPGMGSAAAANPHAAAPGTGNPAAPGPAVMPTKTGAPGAGNAAAPAKTPAAGAAAPAAPAKTPAAGAAAPAAPAKAPAAPAAPAAGSAAAPAH